MDEAPLAILTPHVFDELLGQIWSESIVAERPEREPLGQLETVQPLKITRPTLFGWVDLAEQILCHNSPEWCFL